MVPPGPGASEFGRHIFERSMRYRLPTVSRAYIPWVLVRSDFFKAMHRAMDLVPVEQQEEAEEFFGSVEGMIYVPTV